MPSDTYSSPCPHLSGQGFQNMKQAQRDLPGLIFAFFKSELIPFLTMVSINNTAMVATYRCYGDSYNFNWQTGSAPSILQVVLARCKLVTNKWSMTQPSGTPNLPQFISFILGKTPYNFTIHFPKWKGHSQGTECSQSIRICNAYD